MDQEEIVERLVPLGLLDLPDPVVNQDHLDREENLELLDLQVCEMKQFECIFCLFL